MSYGEALERLVGIMARLRAPDGCPWDREQTLETLKPFLIEETYEVLEVIDSGTAEEHCDELGDLLLQVIFQARIREEEGAFDIADVAEAISNKLERRHPHVFGDAEARDADEVRRSWHALKTREKESAGGDQSAVAGVPRALPAVLRGLRLGQKAANVGFDWQDVSGPLARLGEEESELREALAADDGQAIAHELGDCLFTLINICRHTSVDPEAVLQQANDRFESRFRGVEAIAAQAGEALPNLDQATLEAYWQKAKSQLDASTDSD